MARLTKDERYSLRIQRFDQELEWSKKTGWYSLPGALVYLNQTLYGNEAFKESTLKMYAASGKFGKYAIYVNTTILIHKKALEKLQHSGKAAVGRPKNKKTPEKRAFSSI